MINSLNKNNKQIMESITLQDFAIHKFEPNNIIMVHKTTKDLYQYFQTPIIAPKQKIFHHDNLLQAQFLPTGIIYKKGITTMQNEISKRMKSSVKQYYEEQELINTFLPVLNCLQYLHSQDIIHGSICPQHIIFNEEGDILLRDWLIQNGSNKYYETKNVKERTKNDDISALGQIIYQASSLMDFKEELKANLSFDNLFRKILPKYSRGYILGIYIMVKKIQKFYPQLQKILQNDETYIENSEQLVSIYKKIKGQKQNKPVISPILNYNNFKFLDTMSKAQLTTKKVQKNQDAENKRTFDDIKRKNFDRINRIVQKNSNNEIVKKIDMALKRVSNMKISNQQENQKIPKKNLLKQDILKFGSPLKRLKTFSKKKAF